MKSSHNRPAEPRSSVFKAHTGRKSGAQRSARPTARPAERRKGGQPVNMCHRSVKSGCFAILNPCTRKMATREHVPQAGRTEGFARSQPVHKRVAEQMSPKGCGCPRRDDRSRHAVGVQSLRLSKAVGRDYKNWGEIPVDSRHATV